MKLYLKRTSFAYCLKRYFRNPSSVLSGDMMYAKNQAAKMVSAVAGTAIMMYTHKRGTVIDVKVGISIDMIDEIRESGLFAASASAE